MTTEIEQEFFKCFGIEPKIYETDGRDIDDNGDVCSWYIEEVYPEITAEILLKLLCINNKHIHLHSEFCGSPVFGESYEEIKNYILKFMTWNFTLYEEDFKQQVRSLFEEEE